MLTSYGVMESRILFHGSNREVSKPRILQNGFYKDFGYGFYCTNFEKQAKRWALSKKGMPVVNQYSYLPDASLNVLIFEEMTEEWLDFILKCRRKQDSSDYDIVMGGVANDKVFNTVELYFDHLIDKQEAIKRLRYEKPNMQICFRSERALKQLHFEGSFEV